MPIKNKFSGLSVPVASSDEGLKFNQENIERYRNAQLKLDRIWMQNEDDITTNLYEIFDKYNKKGIGLPEKYDYADVMDALEEIYSDENAEELIQAIERVAINYGYTDEMDDEELTIDITQDMCWHTNQSLMSLLTNIKQKYDSIDNDSKNKLADKIDGAYKAYELEEGVRPTKVHRGEIWRAILPMGVGYETNGYRWVIIISNEKHAEISSVVNVVYMVGQDVRNPVSQLSIKQSDLRDGTLEKSKCRVNLTDIYSLDKLKLVERKGEVSAKFMKILMERIAKQLDI